MIRCSSTRSVGTPDALTRRHRRRKAGRVRACESPTAKSRDVVVVDDARKRGREGRRRRRAGARLAGKKRRLHSYTWRRTCPALRCSGGGCSAEDDGEALALAPRVAEQALDCLEGRPACVCRGGASRERRQHRGRGPNRRERERGCGRRSPLTTVFLIPAMRGVGVQVATEKRHPRQRAGTQDETVPITAHTGRDGVAGSSAAVGEGRRPEGSGSPRREETDTLALRVSSVAGRCAGGGERRVEEFTIVTVNLAPHWPFEGRNAP